MKHCHCLSKHSMQKNGKINNNHGKLQITPPTRKLGSSETVWSGTGRTFRKQDVELRTIWPVIKVPVEYQIQEDEENPTCHNLLHNSALPHQQWAKKNSTEDWPQHFKWSMQSPWHVLTLPLTLVSNIYSQGTKKHQKDLGRNYPMHHTVVYKLMKETAGSSGELNPDPPEGLV